MQVKIEVVPKPVPVVGAVSHLGAEERAARAAFRVALVTMPFVSTDRPSIQLGLLKPLAESHGFPTTTFHLNLELAQQIGRDFYEEFCLHSASMLGEWMFSKVAFGDSAPDPGGLLFETDEWAMLSGRAPDEEKLLQARDVQIPRYLDRVTSIVDWSRFSVVGFTSSFQQNAASIALASALKQRWPDVTTVFGGSNLEGMMGHGLMRSINAIDYAITGEADVAFPALLMSLCHDGDPTSVPGVLARHDDVVTSGGTQPLLERLDDLPVPDYDEYFDRSERLGLLRESGRRTTSLPYESARGCWWGAKRHCTFCGLNGNSMSFRGKTPGRVRDELAQLAERYHSFSFVAVDNILEPSYLDNLFPALVADRSTYDLFYEVKANLSPEQLRIMRAAGVKRIQPGIESLNSHVLGLMRKGTRASTNVNLLRWARYYEIDVVWNLLWGFPGETAEDYRTQAEMIPSLTHLRPPGHRGRITMDRFSPLFEDRDRFAATSVRPNWSYRYVYPDTVEIENVAYLFDYRLKDALPDRAYEQTSKAVQDWLTSWATGSCPELRLWRSPDLLQIDDARDPAAPSTYTLRGPLAALYLACFDRPRKFDDIGKRAGLSDPASEVEAALDQFVDRRLMMRDGNLFLALAIPANRTYAHRPASAVDGR